MQTKRVKTFCGDLVYTMPGVLETMELFETVGLEDDPSRVTVLKSTIKNMGHLLDLSGLEYEGKKYSTYDEVLSDARFLAPLNVIATEIFAHLAPETMPEDSDAKKKPSPSKRRRSSGQRA